VSEGAHVVAGTQERYELLAQHSIGARYEYSHDCWPSAQYRSDE
jgi:hypothetical protein